MRLCLKQRAAFFQSLSFVITLRVNKGKKPYRSDQSSDAIKTFVEISTIFYRGCLQRNATAGDTKCLVMNRCSVI